MYTQIVRGCEVLWGRQDLCEEVDVTLPRKTLQVQVVLSIHTTNVFTKKKHQPEYLLHKLSDVLLIVLPWSYTINTELHSDVVVQSRCFFQFVKYCSCQTVWLHTAIAQRSLTRITVFMKRSSTLRHYLCIMAFVCQPKRFNLLSSWATPSKLIWFLILFHCVFVCDWV